MTMTQDILFLNHIFWENFEKIHFFIKESTTWRLKTMTLIELLAPDPSFSSKLQLLAPA